MEPTGLPAWEAQQDRELRSVWAVTPMAVGEPRRRRTARGVPSLVSLRRYLTNAEAATWWAWWRTQSIDGAQAFDATIARFGADVHTVAILPVQPPRLTPQGGGSVWLVELQAVTTETFNLGGAGPGAGGGNTPLDEWRVVGSVTATLTGLGTPLGPTGGIPPQAQRVWDAATSGTAIPNSFQTYFYLRRHLVERANPPGDRTIVSDVISTDSTPPIVQWTPAVSDAAPDLVPFDLANGIWRLQRTQFGSPQPIAFGPNGVLVIGGPGRGLRTVISRTPGSPYANIAWEYQWQAI